jgi:hypothetical protein
MTDVRAALLVRLSPDLKMKLLEIAKRERRSLSKQVEFLLEECLSGSNDAQDEQRAKSVGSSGATKKRPRKLYTQER